MTDLDTTRLFEPIDPNDILHTNGLAWHVQLRSAVRIIDLAELDGSPLPQDNWRQAYIGAIGDAVFARREDEGNVRWIVQIKHLKYAEVDGVNLDTNDVLRTSQGTLTENPDGTLLFITKRTRYVFEVLNAE